MQILSNKFYNLLLEKSNSAVKVQLINTIQSGLDDVYIFEGSDKKIYHVHEDNAEYVLNETEETVTTTKDDSSNDTEAKLKKQYEQGVISYEEYISAMSEIEGNEDLLADVDKIQEDTTFISFSKTIDDIFNIDELPEDVKSKIKSADKMWSRGFNWLLGSTRGVLQFEASVTWVGDKCIINSIGFADGSQWDSSSTVEGAFEKVAESVSRNENIPVEFIEYVPTSPTYKTVLGYKLRECVARLDNGGISNAFCDVDSGHLYQYDAFMIHYKKESATRRVKESKEDKATTKVTNINVAVDMVGPIYLVLYPVDGCDTDECIIKSSIGTIISDINKYKVYGVTSTREMAQELLTTLLNS